MTAEQSKALKPIDTIKNTLMSPFMGSQLKAVLPEHITVEKFQRTALTALINNQDIQGCTVNSIMSSLIKCASDGLQPDGKEAAIIKFKDTAQYLPMVYGVIKRMRNSGEVSDISAHVAYEKDNFEYVIENGRPKMTHKPNLSAEDRGKLVIAYATVLFRNGDVHVEVVTKSEIEKARKASKAPNSPAWTGWYDEMGKKTALHRLKKYVPTSSEIERIIDRELIQAGLDDDAAAKAALDAPSQPAPLSIIDQLNNQADEVETVTGEPVDPKTGEVLQGTGQLQV